MTSWPKLPPLISAFWQKTQRSVQPEKKMAPLPASPETGGSSPIVERRAGDAQGAVGTAGAAAVLGAASPAGTRAEATALVGRECLLHVALPSAPRPWRWHIRSSSTRRRQQPAALHGSQNPLHTKRADHVVARSAIPGGDEGNRTLGLCHATAALSQLSYVPRRVCALVIVPCAHALSNEKTPEPKSSGAKAATSLPAETSMNPPLIRWVPAPAVPPSSTTEDARTGTGIRAPRKRLSVHPVCPAGSVRLQYIRTICEYQS